VNFHSVLYWFSFILVIHHKNDVDEKYRDPERAPCMHITSQKLSYSFGLVGDRGGHKQKSIK